jgi:hypothetical protein
LSAFVAGYTTEGQDTHKTYIREVHYRWHPWHGQQVYVQAEARHAGTMVLRCMREEQTRLAALEIPKWMFDSGLCSMMKPESLARVSLSALRALRALLASGVEGIESGVIEAQHLSSDSGGADVDGERPSGRIVYSPSATAGAAAGSLSADAPLVGPDDERTSSEERSPEYASGGGR